MKQQTTWTLPTSGAWLVAGLNWQYLPLRGRRGMRLRAKAASATHWAEMLTDDGQSQGTLLGTIAITNKAELKHRFTSMALAILPALPRSCYAVFALSPDTYWFIAVNDGMLSPLSDIVGDEHAIRTAAANFLHISGSPPEGWTVYAPCGFFPASEAEEKPLAALTGNNVGLRRARLHSTRPPQFLWVWGISVVAVVAGYLLLSAWQRHNEEARVAVVRAALLARQQAASKAPADSLKPWAKQPRLPSMLNACSTVWKAAHISIAGWIFNTATCDARGKITLDYTLPRGGTVGDFAARLPVIYGQDIKPQFNIPGGADDAVFALPVMLTPPKRPESLRQGSLQIQRLTSYAQRLNAPLRLSELDTSTPLTQGTVQHLPWRTFSFTFITDIPPDRLFTPGRFNSDGFRAATIMTRLKNNRLEYTVEGILYANK
jgi:hypothetical protein